jgi:cell division protease FtsH
MAAEQEVFGVVTTGAEDDLEQSSRIARVMAGRWSMSEQIGPVSVLPRDGEPRMAGVSDEMLDTVDAEVRRISEECYAEARRALRENHDRLDAIVALLLERETLDEAEAYAAAGIPDPASTRCTCRARPEPPRRLAGAAAAAEVAGDCAPAPVRLIIILLVSRWPTWW